MRIAKKKAIIFFIIVILFFLIFLVGKNIFFFIFKPLQNGVFSTGARDELGEKVALEKEITRLKTENIRLKIETEECRVLREYFDFSEISADKLVAVNIIGKRTQSGSSWFLLNKGKASGIEEGLAAVDPKGILIGTIIKAENSISFLRPIFDRHSSIAADIVTQDGSQGVISGIVEGEYGTGMTMKYVPLDKPITQGDAVITSGLEEGLRRGLIIGEVAEVNKKPNAIFQEVAIRPLFNPEGLRIVSIIIP